MLAKLFTIYVYLQTVLCGCGADRRQGGFARPDFAYKLERVGRLDARVPESSGLAQAQGNTFWTHSDSGNPAILYRIGPSGELLQILPLTLPNIDWEDLAEDAEYLYIGDFGNNLNRRRDLRIYRLAKHRAALTDTIHFSLEDQQAFPPKKGNLLYDLEAFFQYQDSLYLFNKSRGRNKQLKLYTLPARPGHYQASLQAQLPLQAMITAAARSPDGKQFALLGYGKLYLFDTAGGRISLEGKRYCLPVGTTGQAEAITYLSPQQLLITNEGGKMYTVTITRKERAAD